MQKNEVQVTQMYVDIIYGPNYYIRFVCASTVYSNVIMTAGKCVVQFYESFVSIKSSGSLSSVKLATFGG